jgi:hypothetical protein
LMPYRELGTPEDLQAALKGVDRLIIDATERAYHRSQEDAKQREHYSGKKKQHTLKNTVMSLPDKLIVFLGRTFSGHNHDYTMLKQEFPPEVDWFSDLHVRVDFIGKYLSGLRKLDCVIIFKAGFEPQLRASPLSISFGMSALGMARQIRDGRLQGGIQPDHVSTLQGLDEVA